MSYRWAGLCLAAVLALLAAACARRPAPSPTVSGSLPLTAPAQALVGRPIRVSVGPVTNADGTPVTLLAVGSYGPRVYRTMIHDGVASFDLPAEDTRYAGTVRLTAVAGAARGEGRINLTPGPPVAPITPLVGPRSITADGQQSTMVIIVPFDDYGNPIAEGTPIQVRARHADGILEEDSLVTGHLLAWQRLLSHTRAGKTLISASVGDERGPEAEVLEVAGWPEPFGVSVVGEPGAADGRQTVLLRTSVLKDRFGNVLSDGTRVTFLVEGPNAQRRSAPTYTIGGVAEVPLQAPSEPGTVAIAAVVHDVASDTIQVAFTPGPAVGDIPVTVEKTADYRGLILRAGPLLGALAQYAPDGTPVEFRLTDPTGNREVVSGVTQNGFAQVELRPSALRVGSYTVDVRAGAGRGSARLSIP